MHSYLICFIITIITFLNGYSQPAEDFYGSYIYADEKISLNLSPPDAYTLFNMEQDRRTGAVTSKELSRGTFEVTDGKIVLEEFPTREKMRLDINSELVLEAQNVKGIESGEALRAWSKQYENGQTSMEGSWKRGKRHGTWIYYNREGDRIRAEQYRRGKLKN